MENKNRVIGEQTANLAGAFMDVNDAITAAGRALAIGNLILPAEYRRFFDEITEGMHWYTGLDDAGREAYLRYPELFNPSYIRNLAPDLAFLGRPEGIYQYTARDLLDFAIWGDSESLIRLFPEHFTVR